MSQPTCAWSCVTVSLSSVSRVALSLAMVCLDLEPVCVVADARHVRGGGPQDAHGAGGAGGENDQQRPSLSTFCSPLLTCEYDTVCRSVGMLCESVGL